MARALFTLTRRRARRLSQNRLVRCHFFPLDIYIETPDKDYQTDVKPTGGGQRIYIK